MPAGHALLAKSGEKRGERGRYKFLQFLTLPPKAQISGITFRYFFAGVIRECGGKMHLRENEFDRAHTDFFEAFKNYDESGSPRRTTCLKYLVLANMLMKSGKKFQLEGQKKKQV